MHIIVQHSNLSNSRLLISTYLFHSVVSSIDPGSVVSVHPQVVDIMRVNVEKVLDRDQKISQLDDRAGIPIVFMDYNF